MLQPLSVSTEKDIFTRLLYFQTESDGSWVSKSEAWFNEHGQSADGSYTAENTAVTTTGTVAGMYWKCTQ